jgi:sugar phosphate isomerase/epimerase
MTVARPMLTVSTGPLWRLDLERAFEVVKETGAEGVEILVTQDTQTQSPNVLEKLANRYDLHIASVHAPQLLVTRSAFTSNQLEKIKRTAELSKALDCQTIVLHPPYVWQLRYSLWVLHELEDALASGGPTITMENMYPVHVGNRRLRFHRFGSAAKLADFQHVTLDTSHLAVSEEDIVEAYRRLADRVVHIHLSDNRGKGRDSHAPLGEGILPITDFVRALTGPALRSVALEVDPGPQVQNLGQVAETLAASLELIRRNLPVPQQPPPPT